MLEVLTFHRRRQSFAGDEAWNGNCKRPRRSPLDLLVHEPQAVGGAVFEPVTRQRHQTCHLDIKESASRCVRVHQSSQTTLQERSMNSLPARHCGKQYQGNIQPSSGNAGHSVTSHGVGKRSSAKPVSLVYYYVGRLRMEGQYGELHEYEVQTMRCVLTFVSSPALFETHAILRIVT